MAEVKRPGGALESRPVHFFWVVDCSASMSGEKIAQVNYAIRDALPGMRTAAEENPQASLMIRAMKFSDGASWLTADPIQVENYEWQDLGTECLTAMGAAFELLSAQLAMPPMPERALPPVIVVLSDGMPTDDYKTSLNKLLSMPWGKKAVKIAISIGEDANDTVLEEFTGNRELVLQANNAEQLYKAIRWASTVAKQVSSVKSREVVKDDQTGQSNAPQGIDLSGIPEPGDDDGVW